MVRKVCLLAVLAFLVLGWSSLATAEETKLYDPVCTMGVSKDTPHFTEFEGKKYLFCSDKCKAQFSKEPVLYACFCLSGSDCPHCIGNSATCPCERKTHGHEHCHGKHKGGP
jgi:YHS domain-containing protein